MKKMDIDRIKLMGHRAFVGGDGDYWDKIGLLQLNFLKSEGLKKNDTLIDIACGSLRAGRLFIDYLNEGKYLGLEKEISLLLYGVSEELGIDKYRDKKPEFVVSGDFEFNKFHGQPNYAIAQSLFTHLTDVDISRCLKLFRKFIKNDVNFYVTFFEVSMPTKNQSYSDSLDSFFYTKKQMQELANDAGWKMHYIGDWGHPRDQKIIKLLRH